MEPAVNAEGFTVSLPALGPLQTPCSPNSLLRRMKNSPRICAVCRALQAPSHNELPKRADSTSLERPAPPACWLSWTSVPGTVRRNYCPKNQRLRRHPRVCVPAPQSIPSKGASTTFKTDGFFSA